MTSLPAPSVALVICSEQLHLRRDSSDYRELLTPGGALYSWFSHWVELKFLKDLERVLILPDYCKLFIWVDLPAILFWPPNLTLSCSYFLLPALSLSDTPVGFWSLDIGLLTCCTTKFVCLSPCMECSFTHVYPKPSPLPMTRSLWKPLPC